MLRRWLLMLLAVLSLCASLSACYQTGRVTGEAVEGVEEGARDLRRGYEKGRE